MCLCGVRRGCDRSGRRHDAGRHITTDATLSKEEDEWGVRPSSGYEVKLSDEERIEYFKWRRKRDVIRRPGQPEPKDEAEKEPETEKKTEPQAEKKTEPEDRRPLDLPPPPPRPGDAAPRAEKKGPFRDRVLEKALEYIRGELQKRPAQDAQVEPAAPPRVEVQPAVRESRAGALQDRTTAQVVR